MPPLVPSQTVRLARHAADLDADGHDINAGGLPTATVVSAQCNTDPLTSPTPNTQTLIPWDTMVEANWYSLGGLLPTASGLSYAAGVFTALEDGVWIINLGVEIVAAPGATGSITLVTPNFGYAPKLLIAAAGNASPWQVERTISMFAGEAFWVGQQSTGSSVAQVYGYAEMDIFRIAGGIKTLPLPTFVTAEVATGMGAAYSVHSAMAPTRGTGTGTAYGASTKIARGAGLASGIGTANNATVSIT